MKRRRRSILFVLCISMLLILSGCASSSNKDSSSSTQSMASEEMEYGGWDTGIAESVEADVEMEQSISASADMEEGLGTYDSTVTTNQQAAENGRKLIKRVNLDMETLEFDSFMNQLNQAISQFGGYIEDSNIYYGTYDYKKSRNACITVRIPADSLDSFVNNIGNKANITNKYESAEDITLSYLDTTSRKKALEIQQERLLELLEKAETMEDIIALESRLSEVTYDLEMAQSTINNYDNLVTYSTITINLYEITRITDPEDETAGARIKAGLNNTLYDMKESSIEFMIWFVTNLPYIAVVLVIVVIIILTIKNHKSHQRKQRQHLLDQTAAMNKISQDTSNQSITSSRNPENQDTPKQS